MNFLRLSFRKRRATIAHIAIQTKKLFTSTRADIHFNPIWIHVVRNGTSRRTACCYGFGKREIGVKNSDLLQQSEKWSLFLVSGTRGTKKLARKFHKFVLVPEGTPGYWKNGCDMRGWIYKGEVNAKSGMKEIHELLREYLEEESDANSRNQVHIGLIKSLSW